MINTKCFDFIKNHMYLMSGFYNKDSLSIEGSCVIDVRHHDKQVIGWVITQGEVSIDGMIISTGYY